MSTETMAQKWEDYFNHAYGGSAPKEQTRELRQAFYAGALVALQFAGYEITSMPDDQAVAAFDRMIREVEQWHINNINSGRTP